MSSNTTPSIGIVGGTGDLGRGLALRLAKAGHDVLVGSRKPAVSYTHLTLPTIE